MSAVVQSMKRSGTGTSSHGMIEGLSRSQSVRSKASIGRTSEEQKKKARRRNSLLYTIFNIGKPWQSREEVVDEYGYGVPVEKEKRARRKLQKKAQPLQPVDDGLKRSASQRVARFLKSPFPYDDRPKAAGGVEPQLWVGQSEYQHEHPWQSQRASRVLEDHTGEPETLSVLESLQEPVPERSSSAPSPSLSPPPQPFFRQPRTRTSELHLGLMGYTATPPYHALTNNSMVNIPEGDIRDQRWGYKPPPPPPLQPARSFETGDDKAGLPIQNASKSTERLKQIASLLSLRQSTKGENQGPEERNSVTGQPTIKALSIMPMPVPKLTPSMMAAAAYSVSESMDSTFPQRKSPPSPLWNGRSRQGPPLSESREASIAAGEAVAEESEKIFPHRSSSESQSPPWLPEVRLTRPSEEDRDREAILAGVTPELAAVVERGRQAVDRRKHRMGPSGDFHEKGESTAASQDGMTGLGISVDTAIGNMLQDANEEADTSPARDPEQGVYWSRRRQTAAEPLGTADANSAEEPQAQTTVHGPSAEREVMISLLQQRWRIFRQDATERLLAQPEDDGPALQDLTAASTTGSGVKMVDQVADRAVLGDPVEHLKVAKWRVSAVVKAVDDIAASEDERAIVSEAGHREEVALLGLEKVAEAVSQARTSQRPNPAQEEQAPARKKAASVVVEEQHKLGAEGESGREEAVAEDSLRGDPMELYFDHQYHL